MNEIANNMETLKDESAKGKRDENNEQHDTQVEVGARIL